MKDAVARKRTGGDFSLPCASILSGPSHTSPFIRDTDLLFNKGLRGACGTLERLWSRPAEWCLLHSVVVGGFHDRMGGCVGCASRVPFTARTGGVGVVFVRLPVSPRVECFAGERSIGVVDCFGPSRIGSLLVVGTADDI